jgi:hypothetical protein
LRGSRLPLSTRQSSLLPHILCLFFSANFLCIRRD